VCARPGRVRGRHFPVLNNGITIVSPDVRLQGNTLHLTNFQIVNGCQTSNVLFENRDHLNDVMVNVKVVETKNEDVFSELVRATNNQTKIEGAQFLSLRPINKRVEQYFNTYEHYEGRLYFERRDRQYVGQDIPVIRIFSLHNAMKCVAAMYCNRPDLASRYPKTMYAELADTIFADSTKEIVFYAACLTLYRFNLLVSNSAIPQNLKRFKWHILPLVRGLICGKTNHPLNSRQAEIAAGSIVETMAQHGTSATEVFIRNRTHGHDHRPMEAASRHAGERRDEHGDRGVTLHVAHGDPTASPTGSAGGGRLPPAPTECRVQISRTVLFRS
jgi:hypothetical protein